MAPTNHERVGKALDLLREGLLPFIERECSSRLGKYWITEVTKDWPHDLDWDEATGQPHLDAAALLRIMTDQWNAVFRDTLGFSERSLASELRDARHRWAHQKVFTGEDTERMLDSAARLLAAISAPQAEEVDAMRKEMRRLNIEEQLRSEKRRNGGSLIASAVLGQLKPWREVITPHQDVASGQYQQAEFAADLWQVHLGEGADEYRDPVEFFRRTFLTESLKQLLVGGVRRLVGRGGDPVVHLQTNFGGGKTHSMLALYHLFSGVSSTRLEGIADVLREVGIDGLPAARRVVLVGNKISPGNPSVKPDGTRVRTLWGELAWQLGGREAYERVRADDEHATNPGDALRELFNQYSPCLVLIDEWVAYARQLHDQSDLPAGSFETQFTFAQALTESARLAENCLLVISLPASDTGHGGTYEVDDVEVGGQRGREALERLRNVVGRVESSWRPATAEESFEIVRRRLFEMPSSPEQFKDRDVVARAFADFYRAHKAEFPPECSTVDYEERIKAAYPIHPEVFDRLYTDWSTLARFQRTRGVLRLMAAVIHSLWEKGDRSPLILPASLPIDDHRVQFELTRYLSPNWVPVIEKDVDGPNSLPMQIDNDVPGLGKYGAARRVARTIYLGSAPLTEAARRGLEDRRVKLGCALPGEQVAVFGDALRRLSANATYLYQDGQRYWYSTQPTVTKLAEDRAEQLKREPEKVARELETRLRRHVEQQKGDFFRVHCMPTSGYDVADEYNARLVVLSADQPYTRGQGNSLAEVAARQILESRGNAPRLYQNTLVFLAADSSRLPDLNEALRKYLAWASIVADSNELDLTPQQARQAENQKAAADSTVNTRLPEAYTWLLVPEQETPQSTVSLKAIKLNGNEALAVRASKKLRNDELLLTSMAGTRLRMEMDRIPLWSGNHVSIKHLVDYFARYIYLPRLQSSEVLLGAVQNGISLLTWEKETFAYADSYDEAAGRYRGLRCGEHLDLADPHTPALLVKGEAARAQLDKEEVPAGPPIDDGGPGGPIGPIGGKKEGGPAPVDFEYFPPPAPPAQPTRFHGTVTLDTLRVGSQAGRIAEEVIAHLAGLLGAEVTVTLEIQASVPNGIPEHVVRTVTENARTLRFDSHGFEKE